MVTSADFFIVERKRVDAPDDLIELGRVGEPYGLKGHVNVLPSSDQPEVLLKTKQWWVSRLRESDGGALGRVKAQKPTADQIVLEPMRVMSAKVHADRIVAYLEGVEDRDVAARFKGGRIYVSRSRFPVLPQGEYYWIDLIGCSVENLQGESLGVVDQVTDHGAHAILSVLEGELNHLIPFVQAYVPEVDLARRRIVVDWQRDYT